MSDSNEPIVPMPDISEPFISWVNEIAEQAAWNSYQQASLYGFARLRLEYPRHLLVTVEPV